MPVINNLVNQVNTSEKCIKVCNALAKAYNAHIKYGPEEEIIGYIASALDCLKIEDKKTFLSKCCITIKDNIYMNFKPGDTTLPFYTQVSKVSHELKHVKQGRNAGWAEFWADYFVDHPHRALYETDALSEELEVLYRLTGRKPNIEEMSKSLLWYKCDSSDVKAALKHLSIVANTVERGGEVCEQIKIIKSTLFPSLTISSLEIHPISLKE